jgi:uncharacterized membrane protein YgcG
MIARRQDWFFQATGSPIYVATFADASGSSPEQAASETFAEWHTRQKRLPADALLLVAFGRERAARRVLGPSVPVEFGESLAALPVSGWEPDQKPGVEIQALIDAMEKRLSPIARSLQRPRRYFVPPAPRGFVLDTDSEASRPERRELEDGLSRLARQSGHTILVATDCPGLPLANGDFSEEDLARWTRDAFAAWQRDRPELDNGAVLFNVRPKQAAMLVFGSKVERRVPAVVTRDLERDAVDAQARANFGKAMVRIATALDRRLGGKWTVSSRSRLDLLLHPWHVATGPDEPAPTWLKIAAFSVLAYLLGWFVWLWIHDPRTMLFLFGGMALSEVLGGVVSSVSGDSAGKLLGGGGSFGGGGCAGQW